MFFSTWFSSWWHKHDGDNKWLTILLFVISIWWKYIVPTNGLENYWYLWLRKVKNLTDSFGKKGITKSGNFLIPTDTNSSQLVTTCWWQPLVTTTLFTLPSFSPFLWSVAKKFQVSFCLKILLMKQEVCEKELVLKLARWSIRPIMNILNCNVFFLKSSMMYLL